MAADTYHKLIHKDSQHAKTITAYLNQLPQRRWKELLIKFYNRGDMPAIRKNIFDKIEGFNEKLHRAHEPTYGRQFCIVSRKKGVAVDISTALFFQIGGLKENIG
jgi:hypothetical protein